MTLEPMRHTLTSAAAAAAARRRRAARGSCSLDRDWDWDWVRQSNVCRSRAATSVYNRLLVGRACV